MEIKIGTKFKPTFKTTSPLTFELVELNREKDYAKVKVSNGNGSVWHEDWDDWHYAEMAFEIGDYVIC